MKLFNKEELRSLIEKGREHCVSIFISTEKVTGRKQKGAIKLKNLLREAENDLKLNGVDKREINKMLEPAYKLVDDSYFWNNQSEGLAIFISENDFIYYRLPKSFEDMVVVENDFHIKPLLSLVSEDGIFYILALSQNEIRLLQCTHSNVHELELENMDIPKSLEEALKYDDPEKQLQLSSHKGTGRGNETLYFGNGDGDEDSKKNILRFFRKVDKGLHDMFKDENAPLILAGVDYLLPIYKKANTYPNLMEEGIIGNPEDKSAQRLHDSAWEIMKPYFKEEQDKAIEHYKNLMKSKSTLNEIDDVVSSAYFQQVDTLFVADGHRIWGAFNPKKNEVVFKERKEEDSEDLLNFAAIQTIVNGGKVYNVDEEKLPEEDIAAILRY